MGQEGKRAQERRATRAARGAMARGTQARACVLEAAGCVRLLAIASQDHDTTGCRRRRSSSQSLLRRWCCRGSRSRLARRQRCVGQDPLAPHAACTRSRLMMHHHPAHRRHRSSGTPRGDVVFGRRGQRASCGGVPDLAPAASLLPCLVHTTKRARCAIAIAEHCRS